MSAPVDLKNPGRKLHVGVILMQGTTEILDVAPVDFLAGISKEIIATYPEGLVPEHMRDQAIDFDFHWVNETGRPAKLTSNITLETTHSFATCPPLDIALMGAHDFGYTPNEAELDFVRKTYEDCAAFLTICGGYMPCVAAGLLKGKTATAPKPLLEHVRATAPETTWLEKRWHQDGKIWTSGTLLNGLDLMRAFAEQTWGGPGTLADFVLDVGGWPVRENNFDA